MQIPIGQIAWILLKHMLHKFQISSRQSPCRMGGDEILQNCGVLHIEYQVREQATTRERERDPAVKVLEQRGQVYKQINLTEKITHELMQWCVVAP